MSSVPRFFVPPNAIHGETAVLPSEVAHHAVNVLRLRVGEAVVLHDGNENAYECHLREVSKNSATVTVVRAYRLNTEPRTRITVAQALPKTTDKIEQVLQHGTEVGAAGFYFFTGFRSVARLAKGEKIEKRLARWEAIVRGAAEQSRRGVLPPVEWLPFTQDVAARIPQFDRAFALHESAETSLPEALAPVTPEARLLVIVGPEGGFTDEEIALLTDHGAPPVSLGPRILRTETAALVALTQILLLTGLSAGGTIQQHS
ncbi:MAG: 16S rRNA (uracil(1498)-N(3))-methyltransferase [Armatimonadaceae bacterium]